MNLPLPPPPPGLYAQFMSFRAWVTAAELLIQQGWDDVRPHLFAALLANAAHGPDYLVKAVELAPGFRTPDEAARWITLAMEVGARLKDPALYRRLTDRDPPPSAEVERPRALTPEALEELLEPGERVLRYLAAPTPDDPYRRPVALVAGPGWLRVFKEVMDESAGPMGITDREDAAYEALAGRVPGLPAYHGTRGGQVMVRDVAHGAMLTTVREEPLAHRLGVLVRVARAVAAVHEAGWWVADLHPDNITAEGVLFDLSHARRCPAGERVPAFPATPAYVAPEVLLHREAGHPADVYALGVLVCEIIACRHPTLLGDRTVHTRPLGLLYHAVPALWREPDLQSLSERVPAPLGEWVRAALNPDPAARPGVGALVELLEAARVEAAEKLKGLDPRSGGSGLRRAPAGAPRVLLPMRAAIPHRGYVRLIGRWVDLGFRPTVALAQSFTATRDRNPIPKWQVARYLRAALEEAGYDSKGVTFLYIPYVGEVLHRYLYALSPGWDETVAVCSGNPEVAALFEPLLEGRAVVTAEAVCGTVEDYNGTRLREAILRGDRETYERLSPPVIVRHLEAIRAAWVRPGEGIDHVPAERVEVAFALEGVDVGGVLKPYEGPEEAILRRLTQRFPRNHFKIRSWADPAGAVIDGVNVCSFRLRFTGQRIDPATGSLVVRFEPEFITR